MYKESTRIAFTSPPARPPWQMGVICFLKEVSQSTITNSSPRLEPGQHNVWKLPGIQSPDTSRPSWALLASASCLASTTLTLGSQSKTHKGTVLGFIFHFKGSVNFVSKAKRSKKKVCLLLMILSCRFIKFLHKGRKLVPESLWEARLGVATGALWL